MFKKYQYLALAALCAASLAGCDKAGSFFGADKKEASFVERIEHTKDDGSVSMLLPDFVQLVQSEGPAVVNIQAAPPRAPKTAAAMPKPIPTRLPTATRSTNFSNASSRTCPKSPKKKQMTAD